MSLDVSYEDINNPPTKPEDMSEEEYAQAQQEAYYFYVIQEFYAICKVFGTAKVMADLKAFKETVEKPEEKPLIQLLP